MKRSHAALAALALFLAGVALRWPGLGTFLTPDEHLWSERTGQFLVGILEHDWPNTVTSGHPGVITTWAGSAGLALKWALARPAGMASLADFGRAVNHGPLERDLLVFLRLPVVLLCAAGVACVYLLARRLLPEAVALLGSFFLLCDPFFLAHSRVLHLDALVTIFITVAWLALLVATRTRRRRYHVLAGLALGLGILTKSPALVLGPLITGWVIYANWRQAGTLRRALLLSLGDFLWLGLPVLAVLVALWPALWIDPVSSAARVLNLMLTYAETSHELGNYWLGKSVSDPGPWFYGAVILWRTTPAVLLGLVLAAGFSILDRGVRKSVPAGETVHEGQSAGWQFSEATVIGALWVLVMWFAVIQTAGVKKFDRYLLPVFPALDLLAAWGWARALLGVRRWISSRRHMPGRAPAPTFGGQQDRLLGLAALLLLIASDALPGLVALPNYLDAYNPLLGGMAAARQVMLVGWGEGLEGAADFANNQGLAGNANVASWYGAAVFAPFYAGETHDLLDASETDLYANDIDYVVTYVNQIQRGLLDREIAGMLSNPVHSEARNGVTVAQVYRWPKPFDHTADRILAPGMRLLGWDGPYYDRDRRQVRGVLYWDATGLGEQGGAPVSAWVKDEDGEIWAKVEAGAPDSQAEATPAWEGRQALAQTMALDVPPGLLPGSYRVQVAAGERTQNLSDVEIPATRLDELTNDASQNLWQTAAGKPTWDGYLRLAGYTLERRDGEVTLDLLWDPQQQPDQAIQLFVHLTDAAGKIMAQADVPLRRPAGDMPPSWQPGDLVRRRVKLALPPNAAAGPYALYAGLYQIDGRRLPLTVDGTAVADGRYLLKTY